MNHGSFDYTILPRDGRTCVRDGPGRTDRTDGGTAARGRDTKTDRLTKRRNERAGADAWIDHFVMIRAFVPSVGSSGCMIRPSIRWTVRFVRGTSTVIFAVINPLSLGDVRKVSFLKNDPATDVLLSHRQSDPTRTPFLIFIWRLRKVSIAHQHPFSPLSHPLKPFIVSQLSLLCSTICCFLCVYHIELGFLL